MPNWEKRAQNRTDSKRILSELGIEFTEHNNGAHLKVGAVDFWPGTGLWRGPSGEGRGVMNLISHLDKVDPPFVNINFLSVEKVFDVAKHSKDKSLMGICQSIHKAIYGGA